MLTCWERIEADKVILKGQAQPLGNRSIGRLVGYRVRDPRRVRGSDGTLLAASVAEGLSQLLGSAFCIDRFRLCRPIASRFGAASSRLARGG